MPRLHAILFFALAATPAFAAEPIVLPGGGKLRTVDFERHVAGLLGRLGCNAGACHGSFQGKGGFRLSLFGYSPAMDHRAVARHSMGRRINTTKPDDSLLLKKPTMQLAHEGGKRLKKDSWQYRVIRRWIADGAKRTSGSGAIRKLEIRPAELTLAAGSSPFAPRMDVLSRSESRQNAARSESRRNGRKLSVIATFANGETEDVTPFCSFRVQNDGVAAVDARGRVSAGVPGDTAIIAEYIGRFATVRVLVPVPTVDRIRWPDATSAGFIDDEVFAKLRTLGIAPSELCNDSDFLRRATISTIGRIPTPNEVRAFLKDQRPDKRRRAIDRLLADPMHAALWATRLCDITGNSTEALPGSQDMQPKYAKMWHDWFRRRIANNTPYSEIVRGVLTATSRGETPLPQWIERRAKLLRTARTSFQTDYAKQPNLDLFWNRPVAKSAEIAAAAFLGVRIECAQCHKHPFDRWTQTDYRSFVNVFAKVRYGSSPELRAAIVDRLDQRRRLRAGGKKLPPPLPRLQETFLAGNVTWQKHPETNAVLKPKALGGPRLSSKDDPRRELFAWLKRNDNPYFARNFVNRVWAHYYGVGLVNPVDDFSVVNPPSNAKLLDRLAQDFIEAGYDIRRLERMILNSTTYQLAAEPNRTNRWDRVNFSRCYVRVLPSEAAVDSLSTALGVQFDFGKDVPKGSRAIEIAPTRLRTLEALRLFSIFPRPERQTVCDCERRNEPSIRQSLFLLSDKAILKHIESGRLKTLLSPARPNEQIIEELYLATLSRFPTQAERESVRKHIAGKTDREKAFADVLWALLNTREFLTNH